MKCLLIIDHILTGGAERILVDYYHYLERNGDKPYVFVLIGNINQSEWARSLNVVYGCTCDEKNIFNKTYQQIYLFFKLWALVRRIRPDVIFSFLERSNLLTILMPTEIKKIVSVHNILSIQYSKVHNILVRKILYRIIWLIYNKCQNVVTVSKQVKDDLVESFGIQADNIYVINNYVDKEDLRSKSYEIVDNFVFQDDVKYVINIGRLSKQKAQWKLLKAFSIYLSTGAEKVELIFMGEGEYLEELKILAANLGIADQTFFLPFNINPYKYMARAHLFVLSSIFEGFPIVLAEISSLRIPFVGSRKAIPGEMFDDKLIWEKCVFDSTFLDEDFSIVIHEDERKLAKLIQDGVENVIFRENVLKHTHMWEENNNKEIQFKLFDQLIKD